MKRYLPLALVLGSAAWIYACSEDASEGAPETVDGGGGGGDDAAAPDTDSGTTPQPSDDGGAPPPADAAPDAPPPWNGNPIDGVTATAITPNTFNDFADGPIWRGGSLFYTLPLSTVIVKFTPPNVFQDTSTAPLATIGTTYDESAGTLVRTEAENAAAPTQNRIVRWTEDGGVTPVTLSYDAGGGAAWDSPNDVVVRKSDGTMYVTDPGYQKELAGGAFVNRIYRITPTGDVFEEVTFALGERPNGVALSPDGKTLYVSLTATKVVQKYAVADDGTLGAAAKLTDTGNDPDGLNVDSAGNVYVAAATGVEVYKPDGNKWGTVTTTVAATGIAFGGADRKTMFITGQGAVFQAPNLKVAGSTQ